MYRLGVVLPTEASWINCMLFDCPCWGAGFKCEEDVDHCMFTMEERKKLAKKRNEMPPQGRMRWLECLYT